MGATEETILKHKQRVSSKMLKFCNALKNRAEHHDDSKLREPELSGWKEMDKEPRYPYGSPEYFDKLQRFSWVLEEHYKHNRHHPEHFQGWWSEMNLLDIVEMLMDWVSYKDNITFEEAEHIIKQQAARYNLPEPIPSILENTLLEIYVKDDREYLEDVLDVKPSKADLEEFCKENHL